MYATCSICLPRTCFSKMVSQKIETGMLHVSQQNQMHIYMYCTWILTIQWNLDYPCLVYPEPQLSGFPNNPKLILNNPPKMGMVTHALYNGGILKVFL